MREIVNNHAASNSLDVRREKTDDLKNVNTMLEQHRKTRHQRDGRHIFCQKPQIFIGNWKIRLKKCYVSWEEEEKSV